RHTSCYRDWSSDVCSSDLCRRPGLSMPRRLFVVRVENPTLPPGSPSEKEAPDGQSGHLVRGSWPRARAGREVLLRAVRLEHAVRSEERRVGEEGGSGRAGG